MKIGVGEHGSTFHPKLYLFALSDRLLCRVGSANLTTSGFGGNTEFVQEYSDDGATAAWFARAWNSFEYPTLEWLDEYELRSRASPKTTAIDQMLPPTPPGHPLESWSAFYGALRRADR